MAQAGAEARSRARPFTSCDSVAGESSRFDEINFFGMSQRTECARTGAQ
jgi:hypothetical protein